MNETEITTRLHLPAVTTFQAVQSSEIITGAVLWRSDVEPKLEQNAEGVYILTLHNQGAYGSFEVPYIAHHILHADDDLVAILVAFHGTQGVYGRKTDRKASKGQFWRFFQKNDDGIWNRVNWKQLNDETRTLILVDYQASDLSWAKAPGKLSTDYRTPRRAKTKTIAYKLVQVRDGRYFSVFQPEEEYILGKLKTQQAKSRHRGGYYSYSSQERLLELFHESRLFPYRCYRQPMELALLECEVGGRIIEYHNGKWASTYLRPLAVLSTFLCVPTV